MSKKSLLLDSTVLNKEIMRLIKQRRRQLLVHSYIYYHLGTSIITDKQFDTWAYQLRDIQKQYPEESKQVEFYDSFVEWDGVSGYNLPYGKLQDVAERLLKIHKGIDGNDQK